MNFTFKTKIKSRNETIVKPYRKFLHKQLPSDKQYWTMSALCGAQGKVVDNSELDHMMKEKLIQQDQFYGVDIDENITKSNLSLSEGHFFCGDFYWTMASYKQFNPGFVNLDLLNTADKEFENIRLVFLLLQPFKDVFLNINVLLGNYHVKERMAQDFVNKIIREDDINYYLRKNNWSTDFNLYLYKGMGSTTKMFSVGLHRKD